MKIDLRWFAAAALVAVAACAPPSTDRSGAAGSPTPAAGEDTMGFEIASAAFAAGGDIPQAHTCDGADVSPPLAWGGVPEGTRSLALIVDDPDAPDPAAPKVVWVHWVLYNLSADLRELPEQVTAETLPPGALEGLNDWKQTGWRGPCPPVGRHRYFFKLYALDVVLPDLNHPTKAALEKAMETHVLARAERMGGYARR